MPPGCPVLLPLFGCLQTPPTTTTTTTTASKTQLVLSQPRKDHLQVTHQGWGHEPGHRG